ncbi:MAG: tetratricopeptide repeat protein [Bacteroidales bacterium]|nr:tetratricopeptide repeat protein [Bacteroidales bacterium]MCF8387751.1 tetratricopeptide repeat protein [Bacteroidales bacterium]MCF8398315.1 tetratricopeptide repeat protein [Bacteroidales bacterium]
MLKRIFVILFVLAYLPGMAQSDNKLVREGNKKYEEGLFEEAEVDYRKALEKNENSLKGEFNLGDAIYQQNNFTESAKVFNEITRKFADKKVRAEAFHNLGNSYLEDKKYKESIEAYKNALRLNPQDYDTKYNLSYAKEKLKEQQQQQQQQNQNQKKNQDQQDSQQDKQKQKQDQQQNQQQQQQDQQRKQQQQQNQQQQQKPGEQKDQQEKQQAQSQPRKISKEDAQRMLQALKDDEKETMKKLLKLQAQKSKSVKTEKDW